MELPDPAGVIASMKGPRPPFRDRALRLLLTAAHRLLKVNWFVRRPRTFGAHALALTPGRKVVLVKLRYAPGWRLPGGGRGKDEDPRDAVLRELREEIGLTSHGRVRLAAELDEATDYKHDLASLLIVEDVRYAPLKWSWEVERICEAELDRLPSGLSRRAERWIDAVRDRL
ncbi:NUDIX domain-containing protein [Sphingomonas hankyongi]|uniref:NUDIX domain-containing protein n=1 Tax=Sphingomonas hankyongi TaxID=2908209 RepID=A0ABT0S0U0_9SPHN|nr:NUDIX domain-containing protein [Sphingomonas hankyongi]MCL6729475.1 NUDIX domain-containing protein [Sphingomonas hankyongi]